MQLRELLEKHIFTIKDKIELKKPINIKGKQYCKDFQKGKNGFCKYYMGCKYNLKSCIDECSK
jgi:hypothetical protein